MKVLKEGGGRRGESGRGKKPGWAQKPGSRGRGEQKPRRVKRLIGDRLP